MFVLLIQASEGNAICFTCCITTGMTWSPQRLTETTWTLVKTAHAVLPLAWPDRHREPQKPPGNWWKLHTLYYHWNDLIVIETHRNHLDTGENCTAVLPLAWPDRHRDLQKPPGHWWKLHTLYYHWHDLIVIETHRNHLDTGENCTAVLPLAWPDRHRDPQKPPGHWWKLHTLYYHWHDLIVIETHRNHLDTGENCTAVLPLAWPVHHRDPQKPPGHWWKLHTLYYHWHDLIVIETHRNHLDTGENCTAVLPLAWPVHHRDPQKPPGHWWKLHTMYYHWHDLIATETHRNHLDTGENCTRCITTGMTWSPQRPTETTWTLVKTAHALLPLAWPDRHRDSQKPPGHWWKLHTMYYHWHDLIATETHRNHLDTSENCTRCITTGMTWSPQRLTETTWTLVKTAHAVLPLAWPDRHRDSQKPPGHLWKLHTLYYHWHDLFATETHRNHLDTGENYTRCITTGMTWSPQRLTETTWTLVKTAHAVLPLAWPDRHRDSQKPPGH